MTPIVETLVSAFCLVAAGMLLTDAAATLIVALLYRRKRRGVLERCDGERTSG